MSYANIFRKIPEIKPVVWGILATLVILGVLGIVITRNKPKWNTRMLVYGALSLALSFVMSYIVMFKMPQGGSITPASMLPIMLYAYTFGPVPGLIVGAADGLLQLLQDPYIVHPIQVILDYPLAFAMIGLAGCFYKKRDMLGIEAGILLAGVGRYVCAVISGVVFFAEYAPEGQSALVYSLGYNGAYMGVEIAICFVIALAALVPGVKKQLDKLAQKAQSDA